jgi:AAA domain
MNESKNIWEALDAWRNSLAKWQRCLVSKAISKGRLSTEDIAEVFEILQHTNGLSDSGEDEPSPTASPRAEKAYRPLRLAKIDGLAGINAIPDGSTLTFDPGLTVVYGRNGAGKSGFARLLANACFSRYTPDILANIYAEHECASPAAVFHIELDGELQPPIQYSLEMKHDELQRMCFFDVTIAKLHVSHASNFEFKPSGFDVFPEMARVYGELSKLLIAEIQARTSSVNFSDSFIGDETAVSKAVASIGRKADMPTIHKLATYGSAEQARFKELDGQIVALKSKSPQAVLAELNAAKKEIEALSAKLSTLAGSFTAAAEEARNELSLIAKQQAAAAALLGTEIFKRPFFKAVGAAEWDTFARAAHALARAESEDYPSDGDRCLLCERPIDQNSGEHIASLLCFVEGDAKKSAGESAARLSAAATALERLELNLFSDESAVRAYVRRLDPTLEKTIADHISALGELQDRAVAAMLEREPCAGNIDCVGILARLASLGERIAQDVDRLQKTDQTQAIASLELERQTLRHREVLSQLLPQIDKHVADAAWCAKAEKAKSSLSPRHITEKEKELFAEVIGESYRNRLKDESNKLDCALPIEIQTIGQKGKTVRSLQMVGGHKPDTILSEGEQRAVALADFLTEVTLNPASGGIVLDDPVTSQDHQRKALIAKRLVAEAANRQVVVFTHDLPFLNQLISVAETEGCSHQEHWIERGEDGTPGHISLNDAPTTSKNYDTTERAKQCKAEAQKLAGRPRHDAICKGMGALRRTIEETIAKKFLKGVIPRWEDRVIVTGLRKIAWDDTLAEQLCSIFEELSAYIEGHSHTDEAMGAPAEIEDLTKMIDRADPLVGAAKSDKKAKPAAA